MDGGQILIRSKHLNANPRESLFNELILKAEGNVLSKNKYLTSHYKSDKAMHRIFLRLFFGQLGYNSSTKIEMSKSTTTSIRYKHFNKSLL